MQKMVTWLAVFALMIASGGIALADGGSGMCDYSAQAKQVASDKTDTTKDVASQSSPQADTSELMLAQQPERPSKPAPATQK